MFLFFRPLKKKWRLFGAGGFCFPRGQAESRRQERREKERNRKVYF